MGSGRICHTLEVRVWVEKNCRQFQQSGRSLRNHVGEVASWFGNSSSCVNLRNTSCKKCIGPPNPPRVDRHLIGILQCNENWHTTKAMRSNYCYDISSSSCKISLQCIHTFTHIIRHPVKPFNLAAIKGGEFACKFILVPLILVNPNCTIPTLT